MIILTKEQRKLLVYLAAGAGEPGQFAAAHGVKKQAVYQMLRRIESNLQIYNFAELVHYAIRKGLVPLKSFDDVDKVNTKLSV